MSLIYILEDDKNIQEIESYAIKGNGYDVRAFDDAEAFGRGLQEMKPDLVLLDIMLPGEDGLSVLRRLRSDKDTKELPVILVTAKDSEIDTVRGLDLGADDYITKPFGVMELMSRIKAIMRRIKPMSDDVVLKSVLICMSTVLLSPVKSVPHTVSMIISLVSTIPGLERNSRSISYSLNVSSTFSSSARQIRLS